MQPRFERWAGASHRLGGVVSMGRVLGGYNQSVISCEIQFPASWLHSPMNCPVCLGSVCFCCSLVDPLLFQFSYEPRLHSFCELAVTTLLGPDTPSSWPTKGTVPLSTSYKHLVFESHSGLAFMSFQPDWRDPSWSSFHQRKQCERVRFMATVCRKRGQERKNTSKLVQVW